MIEWRNWQLISSHQRSDHSALSSMIRLSVNVNKVATLRNSRGGRVPSVLDAVGVCLDAGRAGHHRASARRSPAHHAGRRARDRAGAARRVDRGSNSTSKAIRGPSCSSSSRRCGRISARSCRSCRVRSRARPGWQPGAATDGLPDVVARLHGRAASASACSSIPMPEPIRWAASVGADRVELYTEPFARAFEQGPDRGGAVVRAVRGRGAAGAQPRPGRQRRARSRSRQPRALPRAAASRRGLDRPRHHLARAVRRACRPSSASTWRCSRRERRCDMIGVQLSAHGVSRSVPADG